MLTEQTSGIRTSGPSLEQAKKKSQLCRLISFQNNLGANEYRKDRRINGLQLPLHPLQLVSWITLVVFVLVAYLIIIPTFQPVLQLPLYTTISILVGIHVVAHVAALLIDPADVELRKVSSRKVVPEFDRSKHLHVIENGRCHLCNIKTSSPRTKHCSVCNKCIEKFDHHCKYLNQCVGKQNYVPFLMCVVSAVVAVLVILAAALAQIVLFYVNPAWLNLWDKSFMSPPLNEKIDVKNSTIDHESTTTLFQLLNDKISNETLLENVTSTIADGEKKSVEGIGTYNTIYLIIIAVTMILAAITTGLLLHLCFFHIYISYLGLTTYEYIRNHRNNISNSNGPSTSERNESLVKEIYLCSKINPSGLQHRPKTLHCCEASRECHQEIISSNTTSDDTTAEIAHKAFYLCTVLEETRATVKDISSANCKTSNKTRAFHCCSEFLQTTHSHNGAQKTLHLTEQCTFCSFSIKTQKKIEHSNKRCCIKSISKHHRWRRKWNCCSNVPNSPEDLPGDNLRVVTGEIAPFHSSVETVQASTTTQPRYVQIEVPIENGANDPESSSNIFIENNHEYMIRELSNGSKNILQETEVSTTPTIAECSNQTEMLPTISAHICSPSNNMKRTRSKLIRPWPVRLRHMFRMINRYRRPRCRNINSLKQNQIRPFPCSNSTVNVNEDSNLHPANDHQTTSVPSAPPPNRRKLKTPSDLQDVTNTFSMIQQSSGCRVPPNQQIRRPRRKNNLRNRSPTLSPIHESFENSNPTSPQLTCRNSCSGSISSIGNSSFCGNRNTNDAMT